MKTESRDNQPERAAGTTDTVVEVKSLTRRFGSFIAVAAGC